MRTIKILFATLAIVLASSTAVFAQSGKLQEKATAWVDEKIEAPLKDNGLELTEAQKAELVTERIAVMKEMRKIRKSEASEEEQKAAKKEVMKAFNKKKKAILTPEQFQATKKKH